MMNDLILPVDKTEIEKMVEEFEKHYYDIPFGNSEFQITNFVVNSQLTPSRAYRAIGLTMSAKIRALKEAMYSIEKENIDIEEMRENLENETNKFEKRRIEIDIQQKLDNRQYTQKLGNDAWKELKQLYKYFKVLPKFTREEFEKGEREYFEKSLIRKSIGVDGANDSLLAMGIDKVTMKKMQLEIANTDDDIFTKGLNIENLEKGLLTND